MKSVKIFLFLSLVGAFAFAEQAKLTVEIPKISAAEGFLLISVFKGAYGFPEDPTKAAAISSTSAQKGMNQVSFDVEPGIYAVAIVHDVNANGVLDTNSFGIPTEPVGFSNDPTLMGKPTFDQTKFSVVAPATTKVIKVKGIFVTKPL